MTSSALDYAKNIDTSYPSAGKDNRSQGFRDNFKNIYQALISISDNINYLQQTTIKISQIIYPNNLPLPKIKTSTEIADVGVYPDFFPLTNVSSLSSAGGTYFQVTSTQNVLVNATVNFTTTSTTYLVDSITPNTTIIPTTILPNIVGSTSYFKNPYFESAPITYTLSNFSSSTNFGRVERPIGTIYATKTRLEVQFNNYGTTGSSVNSNTFIINMPANTLPDVTDNSSNLAKTNFIHSILPYGTIIMWFGKRSKVPTGWAICDGENGTPDLISKFSIGGEFDHINITTGEYEGPGSSINGVNTATQADIPQVDLLDVPYHTHLATFTGTPQSHGHMIDEVPHSHRFYNLVGSDADNNGANGHGYGSMIMTTTNTTTGITVVPAPITPDGTVDIRSTGTEISVNYILPPFAALYYIMKITGEDLTT
jgi:hypothetical protein